MLVPVTDLTALSDPPSPTSPTSPSPCDVSAVGAAMAPPSLRPTQNLNVIGTRPLISPGDLNVELAAGQEASATVLEGREVIRDILEGRDERLLVVIGPCSIHDPAAALEYAARLTELRDRVADRLYVVMRIYFEKPRTTVGWKGLINDPHLDGSFDMAEGIRAARRLLIEVNRLGVPAGTEFLDPITPQYLDDLVAWAAIGARTTESQTHRQMASGLSMPVGYKNGTDGNLQVAIDAMRAAQKPHHFLGIDEEGRSCIVATRGNRLGHVILRGGRDEPNFHPHRVAQAAATLTAHQLDPVVMIDCSHANSGKRHEAQEEVWNSLIDQRRAGCPDEAVNGRCPVIGAMIESNLFEGRQDLGDDPNDLRYGVSITDECIGWEKTRAMLVEGWERLG